MSVRKKEINIKKRKERGERSRNAFFFVYAECSHKTGRQAGASKYQDVGVRRGAAAISRLRSFHTHK